MTRAICTFNLHFSTDGGSGGSSRHEERATSMVNTLRVILIIMSYVIWSTRPCCYGLFRCLFIQRDMLYPQTKIRQSIYKNLQNSRRDQGQGI